MKKIILLIVSALTIAAFVSCGPVDAENEKDFKGSITVAVGIVPEAMFVEKVAGDLVQVVTMIPPGNSPANYQPTAAEMAALSDAKVFFAMQTPTEEANILPKVKDFNSDIEIVNLRDAVSEIYPLRYITGHDHEEEGETEHDADEAEEKTIDPHIWLSPKRVIVMVGAIADKLSEIDGKNEGIYRENAEKYINEIEALDIDLKQAVSALENKTFLIYHGAYGYFAEDYGLEMISLEGAGKPVTAAMMQEVIDYAKNEGIKNVFYQVEFDDRQAKTVAQEIGGNVTRVEPLSPDYIGGLRDFLNALAAQGD